MQSAYRYDSAREEPRRLVRFVAAAFWPDGSSATVLVSNLSYRGCEMQSRRAFEVGQTIGLTLPELGAIHAQIRWIKDGRAGAKFLKGASARDIRRARIGV
jgi:hypothetical protein